MDFAVDPDEDLVEVPFVAGAGAPTAQLIGVGLPELGTPAPDRLIADHDTTRQHQLLDLTKAQREPVLQPHAVGDDLPAGTGVPCTTTMQRSRPPILAATRQLTNLTVPFHSSNECDVQLLGARRDDARDGPPPSLRLFAESSLHPGTLSSQ